MNEGPTPALFLHRTGKPNVLVHARQWKVDQDYHRRTKELDRGFHGDPSDGFDAELSSYGGEVRALGPAIGDFGEMPGGVRIIAEAAAEMLATEQYHGFYSDKKQNAAAAAASFLSQIYRPRGLVALFSTAGASSRSPERPATAPTSALTPKPTTTRRPPSRATSDFSPEATGHLTRPGGVADT